MQIHIEDYYFFEVYVTEFSGNVVLVDHIDCSHNQVASVRAAKEVRFLALTEQAASDAVHYFLALGEEAEVEVEIARSMLVWEMSGLHREEVAV